jgi:hypothetical protein
MTDDLDVALDAAHTDKKSLFKNQLRSIEEEIVERRLIASDTTLQVHDEVGELENVIANLRPMHESAPDTEREKMELSKELREEQRDSWKDVQHLKQEEREVEMELVGENQRHKRTKELL